MSFRMAGLGKWICGAQDEEGYGCTRERAHKDDHAAHDPHGEVLRTWRSRRPATSNA